MTSKFDKPYLEKNIYDSIKVGNLFNLASNFDLEGLRRATLVDKVPLNIVNNNNENLIHIIIKTNSSSVSEEKRLKILNYLVSKGAHPDLSNNEGITPLHYACEKQYKNIMKKLLEYGCDANSKDNFGKTPIHYLLSGIISEWEDKSNKPLFYSKRGGKSKDSKNKILELKNIIYDELKKNNVELEINNFLKGIDLESLNIEIPDLNLKYDVNSDFSLSDLEEKQKTRIYKLKEELDNIFDYSIDEILEIEDDKIIKKSVNNFIQSGILNEKQELIEIVKNYEDKLTNLNNECMNKATNEDLYFTERRGGPVPKNINEYILNNSISPFLPNIDLKNNNFVSNKETSIIYTKLPVGYLNSLLDPTVSELEILIRLMKYSFKNDNTLDINLGIGNIINNNENIESIFNKLSDRGQLPYRTNQEKLNSLLLLGLVVFYYNSSELLNILKINRLNNFFNTGNPDDKYNECIFLRNKLESMIKSGNFPEFIFGVFYYLIEKNIIPENNNGRQRRLYTSCLYLVKIMMEKRVGNKINLLEISRYEREDLNETYEDIQYLNLETTNNVLINPLLKLNESIIPIINRRENKDILDNDFNAKIFGDESHKIYFTKRYEWILPSLKEILGYHYLIENLSDVDLNQGIFVNRILGCRYISNAPKENVDINVDHENPGYVNGTIKKSYINKLNLNEKMKENICKYFNIYQQILYSGDYPLLKIFSLEDTNKFRQYFNKVVPYHLKNILLLDYLREIQSINNVNLRLNINLSRFDNIINNISIYNYIMTRLNTDGNILQIPHFYFYEIDNKNLYYPILSYNKNGSKDLEEIVNEPNLITNEYLKPKINVEKLRISKDILPPSLKTEIGLNLLLQLTIMKRLNIPDRIINICEEVVTNAGYMKGSIDLNETIVGMLNDLYMEVGKSLLEKQLNLVSINKLGESNELLRKIGNEIEENISFLKSTDFELSLTDDKKQISLFPIIEENKVELPELYFSNDYSVDEFVDKLYEIKYKDETLEVLIENGCNPFIVDNLQQSSLHLLSTNYLYKPLKKLIELGIDFRQVDENGYNFINKIDKELEYHKSFINLEKDNFREIVNDLVEPFYKMIKSKIDKTRLSGFNHLRYTRLGLDLVAYYMLVNKKDLINLLPSKIYPSDLVLAKFLVSPDSKLIKSRERPSNISDKSNLVEKHLDFLGIFSDAPGVFLDEFENILTSKKLLDNLDEINLTSEKCINYLTNEKVCTKEEVNDINNILLLVSKQVLGTQIIYLLTNLLNAHLKMKFVKLDSDDRVRIIESILHESPILEDEQRKSILSIILKESLPKLIKSNLYIYEDDIEMNEKPDFTPTDLCENIKNGLKLIPEYFNENDKLITEVIPDFLVDYLELYLPEILRCMRFIVENIMKWKINYDKLNELNKLIPK